MANTDIVSILLKLEQVRQFVSGADQASKAVGKIGTEAEQTGKKASTAWKGIAKWAAGAGVLYGASRAIHSAVDATESLAKSTVAIQRQTNLDTQTASEWVGVLKERGIATTSFQVGLKTLSKQMEKSRTGTALETSQMKLLHRQYEAISAEGGKKAPAALAKLQGQMTRVGLAGDKARGLLEKLHVPFDLIRSGNTKGVILSVADALSKMTNPAERSTAAQTLFGRTGITLLPILAKGRKGIEEQLGIQQRYGNYIGGKGLDNAKKLIEQQREMHAAWEGAKVQLGQALLPVLISIGKILVNLARFLAPLTKNATVMKVVVIALTAAFVAYQVAMVAATIATTVFETAAAPVVGITLGVVAAVALLAIGIYELWKHCKWFRDGVKEAWAMAKVAFQGILQAAQVVFNWVKQNWPLLVGALFGPFGVAAALVITHWKQVKDFLLGVFDAVKSKATSVANGIAGVFQSVVGAIKSALNTLISGWNALHFKLPGFKVGPVHFGGKTIGLPTVPLLASGGYVHRSGAALVGERGPEMVTLPRGASVLPLPAPEAAVAGAAAGGGDLVVEVPVYLDRKVLAQSVARVTADKLARR